MPTLELLSSLGSMCRRIGLWRWDPLIIRLEANLLLGFPAQEKTLRNAPPPPPCQQSALNYTGHCPNTIRPILSTESQRRKRLHDMAIDTTYKLLANRRTKIVATLGPASHSQERISALIQAGVDMFRLNMSHGTHEEHYVNYHHIRQLAQASKKHIAILADLSGPKIRTGVFPDGPITLNNGQSVTVTTREVPGEPELIPSQYAGLADDVTLGDRVLLADGVMELRVESVEGTEVRCTVVTGGELGDRKGINLPGVDVSASSLTLKDRSDARFALELGVDFLAQSFVRRATDVQELKQFIEEAGHNTLVIAKIERPEALHDGDEILKVADAIMVARGDLGVELPPEEVPVAQRLLVDHARAHNKPVIVATQMLESMIDNPRPTRAEVTDVSHTTFNGADAIMLSAETATGSHPVLAVEMMDRIARQTEGYLWTEAAFGNFRRNETTTPPIPFGDAIARSTALLSRDLMVRGIAVITEGGRSATTVSAGRPAAPILAVSSNPQTCRRMNLMWGVIPVLVSAEELSEPIALIRRLAARFKLVAPNDFVLLVQGFHQDVQKNTPSITLLRV